MTVEAMTLHIPAPLYQLLKQWAAQANRMVEAEALDVLATAMLLAAELSADLAEALAPWPCSMTKPCGGQRVPGWWPTPSRSSKNFISSVSVRG